MKNKLIISAAALMLAAAAGFTQSANDFEVKQNADNTLTITKYNGAATSVVIPSTLHGLKVTVIGKEAFQYYSGRRESKLTNVVIPNTVTSIEYEAFAYNDISEITLPASLRKIGFGAFKNNKIRTLVIPDGVTLISSLDTHIPQEYIQGLGWVNKPEAYASNGAFAGNPIEFLSIPASLAKESSSKISKLDDKIALMTEGDVWKTTAGIDNLTFGRNTPDYIIIPAGMDDNNMTVNFDESLVNFWKSQNKAAGGYVKRGAIWTRVSAAEANQIFKDEQKAALEKEKAAEEAERKAAARREEERKQAATAAAKAAEAEKRRVRPAFGIYAVPGTGGGTNIGLQLLTCGGLAGVNIGGRVNVLANAEAGIGVTAKSRVKGTYQDRDIDGKSSRSSYKFHFPRSYNLGGILEMSLLEYVWLGAGGGIAGIENRAKITKYEEPYQNSSTLKHERFAKEKQSSLSFPYIRGTIALHNRLGGAMLKAYYDYNFNKNGFKAGLAFGYLWI